jgi:hypothetical protein
MNYIGTKITKNFAWELGFFYLLRDFKDGIDFIDIGICLDLFKNDHKPSFRVGFVLFNIMVFEFNVYNVNHMEDTDE